MNLPTCLSILRIRVYANDKTGRQNMQMGKVKKEERKNNSNTKICSTQNVWAAACQVVSSRQYCVGIVEGARHAERAWARGLLGFTYWSSITICSKSVLIFHKWRNIRIMPTVPMSSKCLIQLNNLAGQIYLFYLNILGTEQWFSIKNICSWKFLILLYMACFPKIYFANKTYVVCSRFCSSNI